MFLMQNDQNRRTTGDSIHRKQPSHFEPARGPLRAAIRF
jgi:hypothetical protein